MSRALLAVIVIGFMSMVTFFTLCGIESSTTEEKILAVVSGIIGGFIGLLILML